MLITAAVRKPMLNTCSPFQTPTLGRKASAMLQLYLGKVEYRRGQTAGLWPTYHYSQEELLVNSWTQGGKMYQTEYNF